MTETVPVTFTIETSLLDGLDALARSMGRDRQWILDRAVRDYIDDNRTFAAEVLNGIRAADGENCVSEEEIEAVLGKYRRENACP